MGYQSPIDIIMGQMNISFENGICKAVQNAGINVDKEELLKALQYDREQYQKGYADRDCEIIRIKETCRRVIKDFKSFVDKFECFSTSDDYDFEMLKTVYIILQELEG